MTTEHGIPETVSTGSQMELTLFPMGTIQPRHPSSQRFHDALAELGELHDKKQKDYGTDTDPFANVRATEDWGQPAWVGAMIRGTDKVKRIQKYARVGDLANESVEDAFKDLAVYALIALVLWEEENGAEA